MSTRFFSTAAVRALKDSAKASAIAVEPKMANKSVGNSFKSFAEYRKSAIHHGPMRKSLIYKTIPSEQQTVASEHRDYGVSEQFARYARSNAYRE